MSISYLANIGATRGVLDEFGLSAKYKFGQNFLINDSIISRIISLADVRDDDSILEVGPGIGTLTVALLKESSSVTALELDEDLIDVLLSTCSENLDRLNIIQGDALKVDCRAFNANKLVSNLPYNIAATLILDLFQKVSSIKSAVVMVQKEVADRICSEIGSKNYGAYSVKLSFFASVADRFEVSRNNFYPSPRVDSSVIKLIRNCDNIRDAEHIMHVVDAAFSKRRKTIKNAMSGFEWSLDELNSAFEACGIESSIRAERLSKCDFISLSSHLS